KLYLNLDNLIEDIEKAMNAYFIELENDNDLLEKARIRIKCFSLLKEYKISSPFPNQKANETEKGTSLRPDSNDMKTSSLIKNKRFDKFKTARSTLGSTDMK
ncbi:MAG: hypothetical protein WA125_10340, partial [Desulfosporosinus sp.]